MVKQVESSRVEMGGLYVGFVVWSVTSVHSHFKTDRVSTQRKYVYVPKFSMYNYVLIENLL